MKTTAELEAKSSVTTDKMLEVSENEMNTIRQLRLTNYDNFPIADFLSISFTHHIAIINNAKELDERLFYIRYCHNYKPTIDDPDFINAPPKLKFATIQVKKWLDCEVLLCQEESFS